MEKCPICGGKGIVIWNFECTTVGCQNYKVVKASAQNDSGNGGYRLYFSSDFFKNFWEENKNPVHVQNRFSFKIYSIDSNCTLTEPECAAIMKSAIKDEYFVPHFTFEIRHNSYSYKVTICDLDDLIEVYFEGENIFTVDFNWPEEYHSAEEQDDDDDC